MSRSKKITELNELTSPASDDLIPIYDVSAGETKKIKPQYLTSGGLTLLTATGVVDDTNQLFDFSQKPTLININGALYPEGVGAFAWSWSDPTVTLAIAVGTGGFIEGVI